MTEGRNLITLTHVIYGLHAFSLLTGIIGAATVVGAFLTGWPSIIAVILNYVKRGEARGTWLESHFRWQIRTFWWGLLWGAIGGPPRPRPLALGALHNSPAMVVSEPNAKRPASAGRRPNVDRICAGSKPVRQDGRAASGR